MTLTEPRVLAADPSPRGPGSESLLVVEGLSIAFGSSTVVHDVSFDIAPGECVALVGESGSGKSVTARALLGVVGRGSAVSARRLRWRDTDLTDLTDAQWRELRGRRIGFVLQDALGSLDPLRRIGAEVGEALVIHDVVPQSRIREEVQDLLARVGVPDPAVRARQYPHELSGGLRQRALIASAISADPDLIIADEPTTALDVTVQARILDLLGDLKRQGKAILLISHDLAVVAHLADRVVVMREGHVVEQGETDAVLRTPTADYTRRLIASIPGAQSRGRSLVTGESADRHPSPPSSDAVVSARNIVKRYNLGKGRSLTAVDGVDFDLAAGEVLGIVGESGSGKSTVGRILLGLTVPDEGAVQVHGTSWTDLGSGDRARLRRRIQIISQDPLSTFDPRYTVERIIGEALPRSSRAARRAAVVDALRQVGLDEKHLRRTPRALSGGQRQRVAIARALATAPDVLVCDEAVSALDVTVQAQVLDLLERLRAETGVAIVFISHDLGVVNHIADRVIVMKDGRVVESGEIHDVFENPRHEYTKALIAAIPSIETPPKQDQP